METRICSSCGINKPLSEFALSRTRKLGREYCCKKCCRERARKWYQNNREKAKETARQWKLKHPERVRVLNRRSSQKFNYGMEDGKFDEMYKKQNGRCAICGEESNLYVDHDHKTNMVRKLLCPRCNHMVGVVEANINLLSKVIQYCNISTQ